MHLASLKGNLVKIHYYIKEIVKILLRDGADPNIRSNNGLSMLHMAV